MCVCVCVGHVLHVHACVPTCDRARMCIVCTCVYMRWYVRIGVRADAYACLCIDACLCVKVCFSDVDQLIGPFDFV